MEIDHKHSYKLWMNYRLQMNKYECGDGVKIGGYDWHI